MIHSTSTVSRADNARVPSLNLVAPLAYRRIMLSLLILASHVQILAQSGSVDASFGVEGNVETGFGRSEVYGYATAIQPDGKILCGGSAFSANTTRDFQRDSYNSVVYRYNPDGSRDLTFGDNGVVVNKIEATGNDNAIYTGVYFIKILEDGRILTYGYRGVDSQFGGLLLTMYHANGSIDNSFGNNGMVLGGFSPNSFGTPLIIQGDGKIVVLGGLYQSSTNADQNFATWAMERYNADGSLDTSYGTNGQVLTTFGTQLNYPSSLALQEDGKVIASGSSGNGRLLLARYTITGQLDPTFDGDGKVITQFGNANNSVYVRVLPNGKIQSAGTTFTSASVHFSVTQYNPNGSLDLTFDGDGRTLALFEAGDESFYISSVAPQLDNKFVVTTNTSNANGFGNLQEFVIRRYNVDGTVDVTFGTNGKSSISPVVGSNVARRAILQTDSKIILVGNSIDAETFEVDLNLLRFTSDGILDSSFDEDGIVTEKIESSNDNGRLVLKQNDGKLIVIGSKRNNPGNVTGLSDVAVARYNVDGTLDSSFGIEGKNEFVFGQLAYTPKKAAIQPDGKMLIANEVLIFGVSTSQEIMRLTENGFLDTTFGEQGKIAISTSTFSQAMALEVLDDGSFIVINHNTNPGGNPDNLYLIIRKFQNNGALDLSFGNNGVTYLEGIFASYPDPDVIIQEDGKILIATTRLNPETFYQGFSVFRLNQDGSVDTEFMNDILTIDFTTDCHAVYLEPDGKIITAGRSVAFTEWFSFYHFVTARFNADGSLDTSYGTDGITRTQFFGPYGWDNRTISSVVRQVDGKFLVGLNRFDPSVASMPYELFDFVVFRFNTDGEYDSNFGENGQLSLSVNNKYDELFSMVLQDDNKIILAGTTDNGVTRDFALTRLENCVNVSSLISATLCSGATYSIEDEVFSESGIYQTTLTSAAGCDSLVTLQLMVLPEVTYSQNISLCAGESFTINGETFSETGIYENVFVAQNGCDSVVTLQLVVLPEVTSSQSISICAGETFSINGETYSEEGVYQTIFSDPNGCDSLVTTTLLIDDLQAQISSSGEQLSAINFPENATFQWLDCENELTAIANETNPVFTPNASGTYAVLVTSGLCSTTSSCENVIVSSIEQLGRSARSSLVVFPNPFDREVEVWLSGFSWPSKYTVFNTTGQVMCTGNLTQESTRLPLNLLAAGLYKILVEDEQGSRITTNIIKD